VRGEAEPPRRGKRRSRHGEGDARTRRGHGNCVLATVLFVARADRVVHDVMTAWSSPMSCSSDTLAPR
jgi:hypothetical protein